VTRALVVDSSSLLAALFDESDGSAHLQTMLGADTCLMSTVTALEAGVVAARRKGAGQVAALDGLVEVLGIAKVPFSEAHATLAQAAYEQYGKGRHPARLDLADCCSYALARETGLPLLAKGDAFPKTDIELVAVGG
jgi:ribonuclease VapC